MVVRPFIVVVCVCRWGLCVHFVLSRRYKMGVFDVIRWKNDCFYKIMSNFVACSDWER